MKQILRMLTAVVLLLAESVRAQELDYFIIGGFNESGGEHAGVEVSGIFFGQSNWGAKYSGVLYTGKTTDGIRDLFGGYSATLFVHARNTISPYAGIGLFGGETFNCTEQEEKDKTCEEDVVLAAYPELGVAVNLKLFHLSAFVRRYSDTNSYTSPVNAVGMSFGFGFQDK